MDNVFPRAMFLGINRRGMVMKEVRSDKLDRLEEQVYAEDEHLKLIPLKPSPSQFPGECILLGVYRLQCQDCR